ncbi:MAG: TonB-dependent receptor [Woeseiaceae bacterium]|nr:TonB-dependent receptor [Woeseiaceae bacterium]
MATKKRASADLQADDARLPLTARRNAVSMAVAAALTGALALPAVAIAQDDDEADNQGRVIEEIVSYGKFRRSLIDSIGTKRDSNQIVEAISAEDIGKLPDSSIAEAISRLPGLAGQRLDGRQSSISIRGLGEDFSTATLNGREQVSIGDNRGIEFDLYPSEIMSGVTVYKTPTASLMNQGIAGTINLMTVRPLDYDRTVQITGHLEQNGHDQLNPDGEDSGHRVTLSYIDTFADDTVGVALAYATMESPNQEERWNSWGFPTTGTGDLELGGAKPFVRSSVLDRDTIMGVLQFEPTDQLSITADALYIDFSDEKNLRGIEIPGAWAGNTTVLNTSNGLVTDGVFNDRRGQVRNDFERRDAELTSFGLNVNYDLNDMWSVTLDASTGEVDRNIWSLESYSGTGRSSDPTAPEDDIAYTMQSGNQGAVFTPTLDYSDSALINLGGAQAWGNNNTVPGDGQDGFINTPTISDKLNSVKLFADAAVDSDFFTGVEFGVYFSEREKKKFDDGLFLTLPTYPNTMPIPSQYSLGEVSLGFIGMGNMVAYDSFQFWLDGGYNETSERLTTAGRWQNTWTIDEQVTIAYAMAEFDTQLGDVGFSGNFGLQYVQTDQRAYGFATYLDNAGLVVPQPVNGGDDYSDVLPSVNLIFHLTDEQLVRFGAARTQSRSRMDRMNASFGISFNSAPTDGINWRANGANPGLKPQQADQFDLTYEWYFTEDSYVGLAYFLKQLDNWQVQIEEPFDFSGLTPPPGAPPNVNPAGFITYWQNTSGGDISGFELAGSYQFGNLVDELEGLGIVASATFIDSSIDVNGNEIQVPGLSEEVFNITLYYERGGFQARVSSSMRDDFLGEVSAISFSRELVSVKSTEIVDAQVSYSFENSNVDWLQGLTIMLQGQNLTDEPFVTFQNNDERQIRDFQDYGRNYLLGASYRF